MKPKLLIGTDCFLPRKDGIAQYLRQVIPSLAADFDITIVAPKYEGYWDKRPFEGMEFVLFELGRISFGDFTLSRPKMARIKELAMAADLIWTHTLGPIGAACIYHAKGKKVVAQVHSRETELVAKSMRFGMAQGVVEFVSKRIIRSLYKRCSLLMVPSEDTRSYIASLGVSAPMKTVHMGIDTALFRPAASSTDAKRALRIQSSTFVFGYTGRIAKEKDLPTLKSAFTLFHKKHPDSLLLIVGDGDRKNLQADGVRITGFVHNVIPFLHAMDVFVLPSLTETTSLSTMEALSCGLPVIVTPVGHVRTYIENEFNGLVFQKGDVEGLLTQMTRLYTDKILLRRIRARARKSIEKKYAVERMQEEVQSLLLTQLKE